MLVERARVDDDIVNICARECSDEPEQFVGFPLYVLDAVAVPYHGDSEALLSAVCVYRKLVPIFLANKPLVEVCYHVDCRDILAADKPCEEVGLR